MFGRRASASALVASGVVLALTACASTAPAEEAAALCEDLGNLVETRAVIVAPPPDATVGDVRGATEKLDPTIEQAEDAGVVPDADADAIRADQEALLEALEGVGDDDELTAMPAEAIEAGRRLTDGLVRLELTLGCEAVDQT